MIQTSKLLRELLNLIQRAWWQLSTCIGHDVKLNDSIEDLVKSLHQLGTFSLVLLRSLIRHCEGLYHRRVDVMTYLDCC
jgi:hypothetical protein